MDGNDISEKPVHGVEDIGEDSLNSIKGDFVAVSPRAKARSSSPRRRVHRQPIHLRVNLTDKQMEELTGEFASQRDPQQPLSRSPHPRHRTHHSDPITPSKKPKEAANDSSPCLGRSLPKSHPCHDETQALSDDHLAECPAPSFSYPRLISLSPEKELPSSHIQATLAERRHQSPPSRLVVGDAHLQYGGSSSQHAVPAQMKPEHGTPRQWVTATADYEWDSESVYSGDENTAARISPLRIPFKNDGCTPADMGDNQILQDYCTWKLSSTGDRDAPGHTGSENLHPEPFANHSGARNDGGAKAAKPQRDALYSPLTPFFADNGGLADRKGSKIMFGQNGWLEKIGSTVEKKKEPQKKSMFGGLKKMAKELASSSGRSRSEEKNLQLYSTIAISLDPREQSLLYCEIEFYLSCAIHGYITVQLNHGRLDPDKLKKIADAWAHKGRPKVIGFRFDLETQIELIGLHIGDFRFYGRRQGNEAQISGLLHTMKVNARSMRTRTFCQPDSVIAKQLVDAQSFFNLLGVPGVQQLALQQVAQFFKVILERERHRTSRHEGSKMPTVSSLVDSQWEKGNRSSAGKASQDAGETHPGI